MASYKIKSGDTLSRVAKAHDLSLNQLLALNPEFKANPNDVNIGDTLIITPPASSRAAGPGAARAKPSPPRATPQPRGPFKLPRGQITFDAEGMEGGAFHSRTLHVPGGSSGATIGRGYDMKLRSKDEIVQDLSVAGVAASDALKLAALRGLKGQAAESEISKKQLGEFEISPGQQRILFLNTYDELAGDVKRICRKADVVAKYGATDWAALDPVIKDIVVDLRYRGDYSPATREKVQPQPRLVANDRTKLARLIADEAYWVRRLGVPMDRFKRRATFIAAAGSA